MRAILKLENIGQRIGEENWEFNSGVVTEIRGRTASGKSRILKSCALALSLPIISDEIRTNAISFGIAKADNAECSPLLNSNKDRAVIELQYDDILKIVELNRDGTEKINTPGNQKFLYCSMLVENSKIHNKIDQGISDFSWIVSEMSLAKDYETIQEVVNSYSDLLNSKKVEIEKKHAEKKKNQDLLENRRTELNETNSEIEKIEEEINDIKIDPQLRTDYKQVEEELKTLKKKQEENKNKLKNLQKDLSEVESILNKNKKTIEKNAEKINELKHEKSELEKIDIMEINKDIQIILEENGDLRESRGKLEQKIKSLKTELKDLTDIHKELLKKSEEKVLCWTCNDGYISKPEFEKQLEEKKKEKTDSQTEFDNLNKKIENNNKEHQQLQKKKEKKNRISDIEEEYDKLSKTIGILGAEDNKLNAKKKEVEGEIPMFSANIESRAKKIKQKDIEYKTIEEKIRKNEQVKPKLDKKNKLTKKLGGIEKEIEKLEEEINLGIFIEFLDFKIEISKANDIFKNLEDIFNNINEYLVSNIKEQREGAAIKFNDNIEKIIQELNFSEFKKISLDLEDYNLNIVRKDNTNQPLNSLSGGEKVVVSSLLQISAKETYNPEIPFLIGDDIILKMDDERREIFHNYLKNIAKKNNWFVILTRVTDEDLIKEEI